MFSGLKLIRSLNKAIDIEINYGKITIHFQIHRETMKARNYSSIANEKIEFAKKRNMINILNKKEYKILQNFKKSVANK